MKHLFVQEVNCEHCENRTCFFRKHLSVEHQAELTRHKRQVIYQKGETIVKYGSFDSNVYYINSGLIKILVEGVNTRQSIYKMITSGDVLNFAPLLANTDYYPFTAIAMKPTEVCVVRKDYIEYALLHNSEFAYQSLLRSGEEFNLFYHRMASFSTSQTPGRLAQTLLYLHEPSLQAEDIYTYITRREIAELGGMSLDSALKLLNELKQDKIITTDGKRVVINDWDMLKRLARIG
ncbi:MAG: Crp/Fnr family transcriptional regulator [Bacteroidota bacterium]